MTERRGHIQRTTQETNVDIAINLDGQGSYSIDTPLGFLSHMLEQLAKHSCIDITLNASGDTHIDGHHLTEDVAIALGQAVAQALGDKKGIYRYGWAMLPMDEACVQCALDLSGRTFFKWAIPLAKTKLGDFETELTEVFFEGFARGAACNLHAYRLAGDNLHHLIEITFKTFAHALRQAISRDPRRHDIPSTKGILNEAATP